MRATGCSLPSSPPRLEVKESACSRPRLDVARSAKALCSSLDWPRTTAMAARRWCGAGPRGEPDTQALGPPTAQRPLAAEQAGPALKLLPAVRRPRLWLRVFGRDTDGLAALAHSARESAVQAVSCSVLFSAAALQEAGDAVAKRSTRASLGALAELQAGRRADCGLPKTAPWTTPGCCRRDPVCRATCGGRDAALCRATRSTAVAATERPPWGGQPP